MSLYDDLVRLNHIAEECNGLAFQFVQQFRNSVPCSYPEALERKRQAEHVLRQLAHAIKQWHLAPNEGGVLWAISQAIGLSQPIFYRGERSILTAHEAAHEIANEVVSAGRLGDQNGDPRDALDNLADRLEGLSVSDLSARIEGEFWEAANLDLDWWGDREEDEAPPRTDSKVGVSLRSAALIVNEDDEEAASKTKTRWKNSRSPKLPDPIGKSQKHRQTNLYSPAELVEFMGEVEPIDKSVVLKELTAIAEPPQSPE